MIEDIESRAAALSTTFHGWLERMSGLSTTPNHQHKTVWAI